MTPQRKGFATPPTERKQVAPAISITNAGVSPLWSNISLDIYPGEWITILGPNGVGKSTLLGAITGTRHLTEGKITVSGRTAYIPQQRLFDPEIPLRAKDLVSLAAGHGIFSRRRTSKQRIHDALASAGAEGLANMRVGLLSGGQQQRIRQAQAIAQDPDILLCDEPLLSLDPSAQREIVELINRRRTEHNTTVLFVTHNINPVIDVSDKVLYLAPNGHQIGTVEEVLRTEVLSELYGSRVEVATINGRMVIV